MKSKKIEQEMLLQNPYGAIELLGEGGFARTYKVDDGGIPKVLKVLHGNSAKAVELFEREARVLQKLRHPGIPRVEVEGYFTFVPDGATKPLHCLAMEFIEGENLERWVEEKGAIAPEVAMDWLKQLVAILKQLHEEKYFHRDIKPPNIMRRPNGQLVLIDFGAVRGITDTYLAKISGDRLNTQIGSFGYWPPEQMDGKPLPQSDFFALGRTFVHLLTGKHPIDIATNSETGELLWRESAPQVSESLADLIDYLMAPFPGKRPQNATVILQRLTDIETGLPIPRRRYQQDSPRRTGAIAKVGVAGLLLLGLTGLRITAPEIATACNKQGVERHDRGELALAKFYYQCATLLQPDYGKAQYNLASLYEELGDLTRARAGYRKAIEGGRAAAYNNFARLEILDNKCDEAIPVLREGLQLARRKAVKEALPANLGRAKLCQNLPWEAKSHLQEAIALGGDRSLATCLLAPVLDELGEKQGALSELEKCPPNAPNALPELDRWMREQTRRQLLETETNSF